jgi:hypothetical protein
MPRDLDAALPTYTTDAMTIQVEGVAYHRNGVGGAGFYVVAFRWAETDDEPRPMIGILFEGACRVAVMDREQARIGNIFMHPTDQHDGGNAWRGDHFQRVLLAAITGEKGHAPWE